MKNRFAKTVLALLLSLAMIMGIVPTSGAAGLGEAPVDTAASEKALSSAADTVATDPGGEAEISSKARAASDPARVIAELDITLDAMSTALTFPRNVVQIRALDSNREDVVELGHFQAPSSGVTVDVRWPLVPDFSSTNPSFGAAYRAEITITAPDNMSFSASLGTTGLSLQTASSKDGRNYPTVEAENLQIVSNLANKLTISGTFTLGGTITYVTAKIAQPVAGAPAYAQPEDVMVKLDGTSADTYVPMTTILTWQESYLHYAPVLDDNGNQIVRPGIIAADCYYDRNMNGRAFQSANGTHYDNTPENRYFYRPKLTLLAQGPYKFDPRITEQNFVVTIDGQNTRYSWKATLDVIDYKRLDLEPVVGTGADAVVELPQAYEGKNVITNVYIALPAIDMTQGAQAPVLTANTSDVTRDVTATFNGRYMQLPLFKPSDAAREVEWIGGVVNGRFDEKDNDGKAKLIIRTATPAGFEYMSNFTSGNVTASWKDGNGLGGTQSQDISKYATPKTDPGTGASYLEFSLEIVIQPVQVTAIDAFEWDPEPAIGLSLKSAQFAAVPYRYGVGLSSEFRKLEADYEGTQRPSEVAGKAVLSWYKNGQAVAAASLNDIIDFNDSLEALITLYATDAFRFPEPVSDPSVEGGVRGPSNFTLPEGWTVNWGSYALDPDNAAGYDNSPKKMTIHRKLVFPARIDRLDTIQMEPLIVGESGPQPASVEATSKAVSTSWFSKEEHKLTGAATFANTAEWSAESTMYGETYDVNLVLKCLDPEFAFDDKLDNDLSRFASNVLQWPVDTSAVEPDVAAVQAADITAVKGSDTMTIHLKVTVPKGEVRAVRISPADLQLIAGEPLTKQVSVVLGGGALNNQENVGSAGVFAPDAQLDGTLVWKLTDPQSLPEMSASTALQGRTYRGELTFTVNGVEQTYVFGTPVEPDVIELYRVEGETKVNVDAAPKVTVEQLITKAKRPIDRVEIKITPPLRGNLATLQSPASMDISTEAEYFVDDEVVATSEVDLSDWWSGGQDDLYAVNLTVALAARDFETYCFRYSEPKFTWDQVKVNIGERVSPLSEFKILGEDYLDPGYDLSQMPGSGFTVTNYLLPASTGISKVELDIIPPWSAGKPDVEVRKTDSESGDYSVLTPSIKFTEGENGKYSGVLTVEAREAENMDGGSVFRDESTAQKWDPETLIELNGMNDAKVTPDYRSAKYVYEDDRLEIPFTIEYAPQAIAEVGLYVPRPILGVTPVDHADLASALRTSRYKVTDTTWTRSAGADREDPFTATVTIEPNRKDPIRDFDDEYLFNPEDWDNASVADVVHLLNIGDNPTPENPVQPLTARVEDGNLVIDLLVYPRAVENEIQRVEMNITLPSLSGLQPGANTVTQIAYYSQSATDMQYAPGNAAVETIIPAANITHDAWVRMANGRYQTTFSIRPDSEYTFKNEGGSEIVRLVVSEGPSPRNIEVTETGTLTFGVECDLVDDVKLIVGSDPAANIADVAVTPEVQAAVPGANGTVELKVQPRDGYSLYGLDSDLQLDKRVRVSSIRALSGRGYAYGLAADSSVTPSSKAYINVRFTPNDVRVTRADGMQVMVNGNTYTMGDPIPEGSEVTVQIANGYELRPGREMTLYNMLNDAPLQVLPTVDNRTFTFTMPSCPVEVDGRVVRPGEPDPDPTPRPSARPTLTPPDDPGPSTPTGDPSSEPSDDPTPSSSPSGRPSSKPTSSPTWSPSGSDDYIKSYQLEDLRTVPGSPVTLSGSGSTKTVKGYEAQTRSGALVRELAGQYLLPDGLDLQVVDSSGRALKSTDRVATGHTLQLINSRKHVLDSAVVSLRGDVTGTGVIGISQLVRMAKAVTYESPLKEPYFSAGDLNGNGRIDLGDMVQLARKLADR